MSVIVQLSLFPLHVQGSLAPHVARIVEVIRASGLPCQLGPMGTAIEGDWNEVMTVIDACYRELEPDFDRLYLSFTADSRRGRKNGLTSKVSSVLTRIEP
ncbi:MTH1187 family thiamine-binding protein [Pseudodesulfovibrio sp. F-1]|uniref:MTH1187 family thiamine-binding protein n=1 Tax=Pseudodesulfovibrio alkaliphilus TaxID=2661613 RepID=A0A7K1KJV2_9BACT|nr:MTH1187 family thiamine-binding protein [Pseudodesulfovibrio alkaliphilus]MUM76357.1 MTH1187 family thiamine-binding protein [Pseudodesulfovibrio alkaliphilus]